MYHTCHVIPVFVVTVSPPPCTPLGTAPSSSQIDGQTVCHGGMRWGVGRDGFQVGGLRWVRVYFIRLNGSTECEQYKNADPGVASLSVSGGDKNSGLVKSQVIAWYEVCRFKQTCRERYVICGCNDGVVNREHSLLLIPPHTCHFLSSAFLHTSNKLNPIYISLKQDF